MLKFSANLSLLFTEYPLIQRFEQAKQHGFHAVEIQFPYSLSVETIAEVLNNTGLKLVLFNIAADDLMQGGEGLASVPEKKDLFKAALQQTIDYAEVLKPVAINLLAGRCFNKNRYDEYLTTFKKNLILAAENFAPLGIKTVFEAINTQDMPEFIIHHTEQQLALLTELNHPNLFIQHDIYHATKMGENSANVIKTHVDKIGHIQFADCPERGQPNTGTINFSELFKLIQESSYNGWCGAEYKPIGNTEQSLLWFKNYNGVQ